MSTNKKILKGSIIAAALLGAGVFASAINDIEGITGKNVIGFSAQPREEPPETQGVYRTWPAYGNPKSTSSGYNRNMGSRVNYKLEINPDTGQKEYIVGVIGDNYSYNDEDKLNQTQHMMDFYENPYTVTLVMYDLDRKPDEGWNEPDYLAGDQGKNPNSDYAKIRVFDEHPKENLIPITSEADWPFDLTAKDLYGETEFLPYQHIAYKIPLSDEAYDHMFATSSSDKNAFYEWGGDSGSVLEFTTDAMHVESNLVISSMIFNNSLGDSIGHPSFYQSADTEPGNSVDNENLFPNISDRNKSLWLKYPEPTLKVTNATKLADNSLEIADGSFKDGYNFNIDYNHSVTGETFSIVHSFDFELYGPSLKGDTNNDVLWDHWHLDDAELTREYRTNPLDPNETNTVTLATNDGSHGSDEFASWFDGVDELTPATVTPNPDALESIDEKDGKGDINIATVDSALFTPGDPDIGTGKNAKPSYTTGYLFSDSDYVAKISVDGVETQFGSKANSFTWPVKNMNLEVNLHTDVYEPEKPVVIKFDPVDEPLHVETGEIRNTYDFTIDTKVDAEFDGTQYYPTGLEYVQLVSSDGSKKYSEPIAVTVTDEVEGIISGQIEAGNLPANKTGLEVKLKMYYGSGIGNVPSGNEVAGKNYWTLISNDFVTTVDTGVRGAADYTASLSADSTTATSANITISTTEVKKIGTEDSTTYFAEGLDAYEKATITDGTVYVSSAPVADITDEDQTTWDAGTTYTNNTEWVLSADNINDLNTTGSTTMTLDGIIPNQEYTFYVDLTYSGETKPADVDGRWDVTWEDSRSIETNEATISTKTVTPYKPDNIELSYTFVPYTDTDSRRGFRYQYEIWMDIAEGNKGIYSASDVTSVKFNSANWPTEVNNEVKPGNVVAEDPSKPNMLYWSSWEVVDGRLHVVLNHKDAGVLDDTVSATITYAGGEITTFDGTGTPPALDASTSIPDRGNYDVSITDPLEDTSLTTTDSITFNGKIHEFVPPTAQESGANKVDQYAFNENFEVTLWDQDGNQLETEASVVTDTGTPVDGDQRTYDYSVKAINLNPNKSYDIQARVTYNGTSKLNDEGQFAGSYPNINDQLTIESEYVAGLNGDTDSIGIEDPMLTITSEPIITLDETSRDIKANGSFTLDVVGKSESVGYNSDFSPTLLSNVAIKDGAGNVLFETDGTKAGASWTVDDTEVTINWEIPESLLEAKTDYDLSIEITYSDGSGGTQTKTYSNDAQKIRFNTGSRGDLTYTGITVEEISNVAGPELKLGYSIDYTGDAGYNYADFNLLTINSVDVNAWETTDLRATDHPDTAWEAGAIEEPIKSLEGFTYDGKQHEVTLGYNELVSELSRYAGAPTGDGLNAKDDLNSNGIFDDAFVYKFTVSVTAEYPDGTTILESDARDYNQFSFLKGGFTPIIRDFNLNEIVVSEDDEPTGSVSGSYWIEHRDAGFYDGMEGTDTSLQDYDELDMWQSGIKSITLYNVTDTDRVIAPVIDPTTDDVTDADATDPFDQEIWNSTSGVSADFLDEPDSWQDTPRTDNEGTTDRAKYDEWLAGEHNLNEFTIDGLTPNQTYSFRLVVHYSGKDGIADHDSAAKDGGYDQIQDFEIAVPTAGFEKVLDEDLTYVSAKSSLTSWTLSYTVTNINLDSRFDPWEFDNIEIIDEDGEVLAYSEDMGGKLEIQNLVPGTNPIDEGWQLIVNTVDGQELIVELNQEWLDSAVNVDGNPLASQDDEGNWNWINSESDAVESWDIGGSILSDDFEITNLTDKSFEMSVTKTSDYDSLVESGELDESSFKLIDKATGETLNATIIDQPTEVVENTRLGEEKLNILVDGLLPETQYGAEGFDVQFSIKDKYAPNANEDGIAVVLATTQAFPDLFTEKTPVEPSGAGLIIGIIIAILIPIVLIVLFILWWFLLVWRKEKEVSFKPQEVTFRLNKDFAKDSEKLKGAKLTHSAGSLNYSISKDMESGKILVTLSGLNTREPIKGLKFIVDNSSVNEANARIESSNNQKQANYDNEVKKHEAEVKVWEDNKAKAATAGTEFKTPKPAAPAKPSLEKKASANKDIKILGSVKTVAPAPKPAAPAKKPVAKGPTATQASGQAKTLDIK